MTSLSPFSHFSVGSSCLQLLSFSLQTCRLLTLIAGVRRSRVRARRPAVLSTQAGTRARAVSARPQGLVLPDPSCWQMVSIFCCSSAFLNALCLCECVCVSECAWWGVSEQAVHLRLRFFTLIRSSRCVMDLTCVVWFQFPDTPGG